MHYHFVDDAEFDRLLATDGLLEWALVHGAARYGTPRAPVENQLRTPSAPVGAPGATTSQPGGAMPRPHRRADAGSSPWPCNATSTPFPRS